MTILGVGLLSIAVAQLTAIKVSSRSKNLQQAMFLAREEMDTLSRRCRTRTRSSGRTSGLPGRSTIRPLQLGSDPDDTTTLHAPDRDHPEPAGERPGARGRHGDLGQREHRRDLADPAQLRHEGQLAMRSTNHSQAGFSLIELMVAVVVLGVVTAQLFIVMGNQKKRLFEQRARGRHPGDRPA